MDFDYSGGVTAPTPPSSAAVTTTETTATVEVNQWGYRTMDSLLKLFKQRMRIGYDTDDENLKAILESSVSAIEKLTGSDDIYDPTIRELVIERSRYAYNDSLEFFYDNFINDLGTASIANLKVVTDDEANF